MKNEASWVYRILGGAIEVAHACMPEAAINISGIPSAYDIAVGRREGDGFTQVASCTEKRESTASTLAQVADFELAPFGKVARVFNVFVDGKLYRQSS